MPSVWQALQRGESVRDRKRHLEHAYERFTLESGHTPDDEFMAEFAASLGLRPVVLDSWLRARQRTLDPDGLPGRPALGEDELRELQNQLPIARALPVVRRLLLDEATESGFIVAVGDADGRLLWVDGERKLRTKAEDMGFSVGTDWSEAAVGTSAPGSALALDHSIQVLGAEHYNRMVHQWSCTAAPVHDPTSGAILGVIDVTGGDEAAAPHILPLLQATLGAVEAELKLDALRSRIEHDRHTRSARVHRANPRTTLVRMMLLGRDPAMLQQGGVSAQLGGRHAEILLALARSRGGLTASTLAEYIYGDPAAAETLRPEIVRLRRWLAQRDFALEVHSRPYRLEGDLRIDALETLQALGRGAHRLALAAYEGPVLASSSAPGMCELREEVDATLRESMLQSASAELLFDYAQNWGDTDEEVWQTLLQVLPPLSPKRSRVVARLEALAT